MNVDEWIDEWFNLWPKRVKSGGYYLRTSKDSCLKKMKKFCTNNPEFSKGIIIAATKAYLKDRERVRYAFTRLAPYFIEKDGISTLEGYCYDLYNKTTSFTDEEEFLSDV